MWKYTTPTRLLSMAGGLAVIAGVAYLNIHGLAQLEGFYSPSVVVFYMFAGGFALAALITPVLFKEQRGLAALICCGVVFGEAFALYSTADRLLSARIERAAKIGDSNLPRKMAEERRARAIADLAASKAEADKARSDKRCGTVCAGWEEREVKARFDLDQAEITLKATSAIRDTAPLASTLGISPKVADIIPSLLGSLAALIMGFGFTSAWRKPPTPEPVVEDIEVSPQPKRRVRMDEGLARIGELRQMNGGVKPKFSVVQKDLDIPKATAHRWLKAAGE